MTNKHRPEKSSPEARGERVRRLRNLANLSRQALCDNGEFKLDTLIGWELARHGGLTEKGAVKLLNCLAGAGVNCTLEWLLHEIGNGPTIASNFTAIQENVTKQTIVPQDEEKHIVEELLLFRKNNPDSVELVVPDYCMSPVYKRGDYVAGIKYYQDKLPALQGYDCIVQPKEGELLLRRIIQGDDPNKYTLIPINFNEAVTPLLLINITLVYAAPIIWHRKKILF